MISGILFYIYLDMNKALQDFLKGYLSAGIEIVSQAVASQVSSSRQSLTSVFGMGTGVTSAP